MKEKIDNFARLVAHFSLMSHRSHWQEPVRCAVVLKSTSDLKSELKLAETLETDTLNALGDTLATRNPSGRMCEVISSIWTYRKISTKANTMLKVLMNVLDQFSEKNRDIEVMLFLDLIMPWIQLFYNFI